MCDQGDIFESTTYGHHAYGSRKSDVENILANGKHVLTVMDICGAMAMKTHFPNVITIYVKRDKKGLLTAILEKDVSTPDKVNRIIAIESEIKNAHICDYTVNFGNIQQAVAQICEKLSIK
jgi:guanylate kinase